MHYYANCVDHSHIQIYWMSKTSSLRTIPSHVHMISLYCLVYTYAICCCHHMHGTQPFGMWDTTGKNIYGRVFMWWLAANFSLLHMPPFHVHQCSPSECCFNYFKDAENTLHALLVCTSICVQEWEVKLLIHSHCTFRTIWGTVMVVHYVWCGECMVTQILSPAKSALVFDTPNLSFQL